MLLKFLKTFLNQNRYNKVKLHLNSHFSSGQIFKPNFFDKNIDKKIFLFDKYSKFSFEKLIDLSTTLGNNLLFKLNKTDLNGEKVGIYCNNNYTYLISILG